MKNCQTAAAGRLPGGSASFRTPARTQRSVNEKWRCAGALLSPSVGFFASRQASERRFLRLLFQHSLVCLLLLLFRSHPSILLCSLRLSTGAYLGLRCCKRRLRCVCLCYFPRAALRGWRLILAQRSGPFGHVQPSRRRLFKWCGWYLAGGTWRTLLWTRGPLAASPGGSGPEVATPRGSGTSVLEYRSEKALLEFPALFSSLLSQ